MASGPAIEVRGLVKRFGATVAVDGLDLDVPEGSCFGLLGPNGAGKTTTVSVLATLLRPTRGSARVCGRDVVRERAAVRRDVGLVFQESTLDPELSAREHLELYARLYHLPDRASRVREILALLGLEEVAARRARQLSGGLRRRLEIGRGLLHRPRVLFLDEPTLGLDVIARTALWSHLRALRADGGTTILLTTHSMEEADALCDEIAIVDRGAVAAAGRPEALTRALGGDVVSLHLRRGDGAPEALARAHGVSRVARDGGVAPAPDGADDGCALRVTLADGPRQLAGLLEAARPFEVLEVHLARATLADVFLHHTGHRLRDGDPPPHGGTG